MKILHIRFCNLNSLAGSWFIDLTAPEYSADGIFAITGPTGAGKTTILDAVCLALYGQTPRLKQVSKSTNEIMTRQTGECWSEVEFSTSKGRYRCHWSQHRARKAAAGELQQPRHEIIDCASGQPLETKIKMVAQKVVEVTGMSFSQFTRSILLAQGEFNSFLKANPDERAPILEQITGTEMYSRISRKVHERKSEEVLLFEQLIKECDGFTPLGAEQLREITTRLEQLRHSAGEAEREITQCRSLLDWHTAQDKLRQEITLQNEQLADLLQQWQAIQPERQQLALAETAKNLEPEYARLMEQRALQVKETEEQKASIALLENIGKELQQTAVRESLANDQLVALKGEAKQQEELLRQVRSLDQQLSLFSDQKTELEQDLLAELTRKQELEQARLDIDRNIRTLGSDLEDLLSYRQSHSEDKRLVEEFSGIRYQLEQYADLSEKYAATAVQLPIVTKGLTRIVAQLAARKLQAQAHAERQQQLEQEGMGIQHQLEQLLAGRTSEQLHAQYARTQELLYDLKQTATLSAQLSRTTVELKELETQDQAIALELRTLEISRGEVTKEHGFRKAAVEKQQRVVELAARIDDLTQQRQLLQEGEPCPLCGSLTHPFKKTGGPVADEERSLLEAETAALEACREKLAAIQATEAGARQKQEQLTVRKAEKILNMEETAAALNTLCARLDLPADDRLQERLDQLGTELRHTQQEIRTALVQTQRLTAQLDNITKVRTDLNRETVAADRQLQQLRHEQETVQTRLQQLSAERSQLEKELGDRQEQLEKKLAPYTATRPALADCRRQIAELEEKRAVWLRQEEQHRVLTTQLQEKRNEQVSQTLLLERQKKTCGEQQARLARVIAYLASLGEQRRLLFGDNNPDAAQLLMRKRLEQAEQNLTEHRNLLTTFKQQHAALTERVETLKTRIGGRTLQLREGTDGFAAALTAAGFTDENHFIGSCLDQERYTELYTAVSRPRKGMDEIKAVLSRTTSALEEERKKQLTDAAPADITTLLAERSELHTALQQETGALNQQLMDNDKQLRHHAEILGQLSTQKNELDRWSRLHELIGSNDGKKFRNFAQGLTFEIMISHANASLRKMSDRYLLVRDPAQPLELHVMDNYQGGEIRSTKNLSGGESFIVSMALALGLSSMASHKVQVDSLFLDEGFGTLDEDALQTALDTLASLHQEGKIIGIISHVSNLRERISTQIRVNRGLGGLSTISGPGAGKWKDSKAA